MKITIKNKSKFLTLAAVILLGLLSTNIFAQTTNDDDSKLNELKGKVEKITVKVDGKEVVFEGKDAQNMADKMRSEKKIRIFSSGDLKELKDGDFDIKKDGITKKVMVNVEDGKKIVTVTTTKDGKEETKTYEGEDAENFMKEGDGSAKNWVTKDGDRHESESNVFYFKHKMDKGKKGEGKCECCGGGCKMEMSTKHGKSIHKMMMKKMGKDCKDSKIIIEKKIEKKEQTNTNKK
ncbi:MAG: hypothetical protein CVV24_04025 [Ignavibacteriae bacterium HGW-Ignavibacteriae-3]|nr:MAG: hypothetical protein CVV24_04025 [Ignavibacteriae bacterium HGW-Ignavibacteriae-3]